MVRRAGDRPTLLPRPMGIDGTGQGNLQRNIRRLRRSQLSDAEQTRLRGSPPLVEHTGDEQQGRHGYGPKHIRLPQPELRRPSNLQGDRGL